MLSKCHYFFQENSIIVSDKETFRTEYQHIGNKQTTKTVGFSPFQDIVLTLKDKLSIRAIEYFALVLEQQYSITKLLLLHEDELIHKVRMQSYSCLSHYHPALLLRSNAND